MLTNKYMDANFFLWGFASGTRTASFYDPYSACSTGNGTRPANLADMSHYTTDNADFPNKIEFYTTQPIGIDRLCGNTTPLVETYNVTSISNGGTYTIATPGDTDFTLIGAADSNVGTTFTATGPGTGTGVVNTADNGSRLLLSFSLATTQTHMKNGVTTMPSLYFYSNDDNKSPVADGTCEWFLLKRNTQIICMGQVSDLVGDGDIKLSSVEMTTSDIYRFYSLKFGINSTDALFTDANTVLVSV